MSEIEKIIAEIAHLNTLRMVNVALAQQDAAKARIYKAHVERFGKQMKELCRDLIGTLNVEE